MSRQDGEGEEIISTQSFLKRKSFLEQAECSKICPAGPIKEKERQLKTSLRATKASSAKRPPVERRTAEPVRLVELMHTLYKG